MRLYSYCIPVDDGAAPNPFWGECTLTICKPVIRRVAERGDWIVGVGSKNVGGTDYSGKLVYAMKVSQVMSLKKYDEYCRGRLTDKIPDINNKDFRRRMGDCIYDYESGQPILRPSVHGQQNVEKDLRGVNALISDCFYYFGNAAVELPEEFSVMVRQGQGHQSTRNQFIKDEFVSWLEGSFERNKLYGEPQVQIDFTTDKKGNLCASRRCEVSELDEVLDYDDEKLPLTHWSYFLALEADLKIISRYVELHESNYETFSIGLTQLFMAACSEIDVVFKQICDLLTGKKLENMGAYTKASIEKLSFLSTKVISIPIYGIAFMPFKNWKVDSKLSWWEAYNEVKHNRNKKLS